MINKLIINNFQSHEKTILKFNPGVNSIIGNSDSGKTAILRALYWVIYNRPSGLAFISYWNRDKNNNPLNKTSVKIISDTYKIERIRQKDFNGYELEINGIRQDPFEAIRMDVPEQIDSVLNLNEVNIQKQMDSPFLLSESAPDVARFLNKTIRLDLIDTILGNAESKRRKINADIKSFDNEIVTIEKELENYTNIEEAEKLNAQLKEIEIEIDSIENEIMEIGNLNNDYKKYLKIIQNYVKIPFKNISLLLEELEEVKKDEIEMKNKIDELNDYQDQYKETDNTIRKLTFELIALEKSLPRNCPYCGYALKEDKCAE